VYQDWQRAQNVTMRRFRITTVSVDEQYELNTVSVCL